MANKEFFLPVATEEDPEQQRGSGSMIPTYYPGTFAGSLSVDDQFPNNNDGSATHQNVLFSNICCDFRRAVLVVNSISIVLKLIIMVGLGLHITYIGNNLKTLESDIQDDHECEQVDVFVKSCVMVVLEAVLEVLETISIGLHACGIYGALDFKQWGIATAGIAYTFQLFVGLISGDIYNIALSAFFLYPHVYMYKLMKAGIMTESNYHKIASCCGDRRM
jgi:hypothetical protein